MNAMKKLSLLLAVMLCVVSLAMPVSAEEAADPVVFTVNGVEVLKSTVDAIADNLYETYTSYGYTLGEEDKVYLNEIAVNYAVQMELMSQKAAELGLDQLTEEELAALTEENHEYWEQAVAYYMEASFGITEESTDEEKADARINTLALLESMGYTEEALLKDAIDSEISGRVYNEMIKGQEVTNEDIRNAFDEHVASDEAAYKDNIYNYELYTQYYGYESYYVPEGYRGVTQILLAVEDELLDAYLTARDQLEAGAEGMTQEQVDAALAAVQAAVQPTYDEIAAKFNAGTAFEALIDEYNTDPGMQNPATRATGYSVHADSVLYDPSFVTAAFSVNNIGEMSQPSIGNYGAYIVYYLRDIPAGPVEFTDEIAASLREEAVAAKEEEAFDAAMSAWVASAEIVYTEAGNAYKPAN